MWSIQHCTHPASTLSLGSPLEPTLLEQVVPAGCPRRSPCFPTQLPDSKTAAPARATVTCSGQSELSTQTSSPMQPSLQMFVLKVMKM